MKVKYVLVFVLIATVLLGAPGSVANAKANANIKITGGGWFIDGLGNKITFGFDGKQTPEPGDAYKAKGQFQLVDHGTGERIHGIIEKLVTSGVAFTGTCSIDGQGDYPLRVTFTDLGEPGIQSGDRISVFIWESGPGLPTRVYAGELKGGNIKIH